MFSQCTFEGSWRKWRDVWLFIHTFRHCVDDALNAWARVCHLRAILSTSAQWDHELSCRMTLCDPFQQRHFHRCRIWNSKWGIYWQFTYRTGARTKYPDSYFNNPWIFLTLSLFVLFCFPFQLKFWTTELRSIKISPWEPPYGLSMYILIGPLLPTQQ